MNKSCEKKVWEAPVLKKGEIKDETLGNPGVLGTDADFVTNS